MKKSDYTVSRYIIDRLLEAGVRHIFGVPGDYVLDFIDEIIDSPINYVGNCNKLNAGYAADGYARLNGSGAAVVTYGVGGLSILNAVAGAFAEQVPLILLSGAPPAHRRESNALVHHLVSGYYLQFEIFKKITVDSAILLDPVKAPDEIDRVIKNCISKKLPVYLEIPADIAITPCVSPKEQLISTPTFSDEDALAECASEVAMKFNNAEHPMVLAGVELLRFGLGREALHLIEAAEVPFATMLSSKSVLPELHPQFVGIYQGGWSRDAVRRQVEEADCLLCLGVRITDLDTGLFSINLDRKKTVFANIENVKVGNHYYQQVQLRDFINRLTPLLNQRSYISSHPTEPYRPRKAFIPKPSTPLTAVRLYECLDSFLDDNMILLSEPGDAFCAAPEFHIDEPENFIVQVYYSSIGYCTSAGLGASLARPEKRPVVLTGDGAFQMTAQEVSTMIKMRCPAIIIIINNDGYLIERMLHEDGPYNDLQMWQYSRLIEVFDDGSFAMGIKATTEEELSHAMETASRERQRLVLIEAYLPGRDCSEGLRRLGESFRKAQK